MILSIKTADFSIASPFFFFFYQYHIFLFQNNIQTFNHAEQEQTKNNQISALLTKLTTSSLRITVH